MKLMLALIKGLSLLAACLCVATTTAQIIGAGYLGAAGALTRGKLVRYAAVLYGMDLSELPAGPAPGESTEPHEPLNRDAMLADRVQSSPLLAARSSAVSNETDNAHILFQELKSDTERFDQLRDRFQSYLAKLENDIRQSALEELRQTLEILPPDQARNLLIRMLDDEGLDPQDDVVADVVAVIKNMPQDKLKKILGEFKTAQQREKLHRVMLEIGEFDERS